jgi:hypothetical protein
MPWWVSNAFALATQSKADPGSLRGQILAKWKELGLAAAPNGGENGVHGSASPLEGLAERMNWVGAKVS